jgi:superfamily II DNA helicase RecQ
VVGVRRGEAVVAVGSEAAATEVTVDFGVEVRVDGQRLRLVAPADQVAANVAALTAWRSARAKAEGKPAYVFLANAHLQDIAERDPDTLLRLARCQGIGPTRLETYGDEILSVLGGGEGGQRDLR